MKNKKEEYLHRLITYKERMQKQKKKGLKLGQHHRVQNAKAELADIKEEINTLIGGDAYLTKVKQDLEDTTLLERGFNRLGKQIGSLFE